MKLDHLQESLKFSLYKSTFSERLYMYSTKVVIYCIYQISFQIPNIAGPFKFPKRKVHSTEFANRFGFGLHVRFLIVHPNDLWMLTAG